jgi:hypothetical protein
MTAEYKRKRLIEENCTDNKTTYIRKNLNSSERIKAKLNIRKTLDGRFMDIRELRWELEMSQSSQCHTNEFAGPQRHIENMLLKLGVGEFYLYKCTCINYDTYSNEQILKMFGL